MSGEAPQGSRDREFLFEILRPKNVALLCIEADQIALGTQRINAFAIDGGSGARPRRIADGIRTIILVLPEDCAVFLVKAQHPLHSGNFALLKWVGWVFCIFC